ncbi:hypothetical protein S225a_23120 [Candidatus Brocadiaceae bacterium S225]|uniref:Uncharacterized protein n=1 Tax=Candidatus Scalindua brodae TaxID=237368 RepID=A0A0B0ENF2_9BACT|nr:MAG: hypothetical protein SCABRO_01600 [Candidatus Scalindua brodae]TWU31089.1 hypothetical protein S225a_23120 [Candidatus Brocadiaceae bacterium S225]
MGDPRTLCMWGSRPDWLFGGSDKGLQKTGAVPIYSEIIAKILSNRSF